MLGTIAHHWLWAHWWSSKRAGHVTKPLANPPRFHAESSACGQTSRLPSLFRTSADRRQPCSRVCRNETALMDLRGLSAAFGHRWSCIITRRCHSAKHSLAPADANVQRCRDKRTHTDAQVACQKSPELAPRVCVWVLSKAGRTRKGKEAVVMSEAAEWAT